MFSEDRQMLSAGAIGATEDTLHGIDESDVQQRCLPRLSQPFHVSMNLDEADVNQQNKRCQLHGLHSTRQTAGCTQTSATSSLSMPQSQGYRPFSCGRTFPLARGIRRIFDWRGGGRNLTPTNLATLFSHHHDISH